MIQSPEWKAIAIAGAVACVSMSLLAIDATIDLNVGGLTKRLQSAQASFVDTMGQYQLAFAVPTWARSKASAERQCPHNQVLTASH
jgi:hypothetical protein